MAGYANRTIMLEFPELTEDGAETPVHVVIKNPRVVPLAELLPPDTPDNAPALDQYLAGCAVIARLVKAWHVFDPRDEGDDQARLPLPATAETVALLPAEVQARIGDLIKAVRSPEA